MKRFAACFVVMIVSFGFSGCESFYKEHYEAIAHARSSGVPILLYMKKVSRPNSVGGVDVEIGFQNLSEKTFKYVFFEVVPYNAVGDIAPSEIGGKVVSNLNFTGPVSPDDYEYARWSNVWYNNTITCIEIAGVDILYMDGTRDSFSKSEIKKISSGNLAVPFNDASSTCDYQE